MLRRAQTNEMQRSKAAFVALIGSLFGFALFGAAATFELENGNTFYGEVSKLDEDGLVIRLEEDIGGFSERIELVYLSQETLKRLAKTPQYKPFVAPFIEMPEEEMAQPPVIILRPVDRLPRASASFFSAFASPIGALFLLAFYLGNLLAAYETAVYRGRSIPLVCGLAVIAPVATPIIFLSMPAAEGSYADPSWEEKAEEAPPPPPVPQEAPRPVGISSNKPSKLGIRQSAAPKSGQEATPSSYTRSNTEFNRHFFETTFSEFFRVVPSPSIKDMVIEFKGTKKELIAKRITRISANEIHLQLLSGKKEAAMRFGEIVQVNLRRKNEK